MRLVVTGASGKLGRLVVAELLERVPADELILLSRSPDSLAEFAQRGAVVRFADFEQAEGLARAFVGAQRALIISTIGTRDAVADHRRAFEAAAAAGIQHITYTSVPNPVADNPFPPARIHRHSEADLRSAGVGWTILRNTLYAELRVEIASAYISAGRWTTNSGTGGHAFVARTDCAKAAAAALTTPERDGRTYHITGPELIDGRHYLALLEEFGGRPIARIDVDDVEYERYRAAFASDPGNAPYFELYPGSGRAIRTGYLDDLGTGVQELTGTAPRSLREVFQTSAQR